VKNRLNAVLIGLFPLFFCGCLATHDDVGVLKTQIAVLNKTLRELQVKQADANHQSEVFTEQLMQTGENLKDFGYKLNSLSLKLDNILNAIKAGSKTQAIAPSDVFYEAKRQYEAKQYSQAAKGFELYLKSLPEGALAEEAYLYSSRAYFETKDYGKAALQAAVLLDKFPDGALAASARLEYAKSIIPLQKKDEAKTYLESITTDFDKSPEAKEAKELLERIK
jgi:TolA-binding protein